jgi:GH25 family lysozyme M1 (1,4-beta-N-acetylmuramidase)
VRVRMFPRSVGVCALLASLGVVGLAGPPATASTAAQALVTSPTVAHEALPGALQGVDVASFQHPANNPTIDWIQVAGAGIQFAAVKATEGNYYKNPWALKDLAGARAAGLSVIAYAFANPNGGGQGHSKSPAVQADYLFSYLGPSFRNVPVLLDIEYDPYVNTDHTNSCYGLTKSAMVQWIAGFDKEVQAKTGRLPIIYTTQSWWHTCTGGGTAFGQTPIWPADPNTPGSPLLPAGWANWAFWQYGLGTVPGINAKDTDLDQLNPSLIPLLSPGARTGAAGGPAAFGVSQADPVNGQTPSFSATGLPPGMSISTDGQITGWPGRPGTYEPAVTATAGGASGSVSFPWTVTLAPGQGPAGPVALNVGGKCLTDVGNRSANGTQAEIGTCNGSAAQRWTYVQDGTVRIHGKCLVAPASPPASGARVKLAPCTGALAQQWWLAYPRSIGSSLGATPVTVLNSASGMCLSDPGRSRTNGTRVIVGPCNGLKDQAWTLPAGPVSSQIPGRCLDDSGNGTANGTTIDLRACNGAVGQQWTTEPNGTMRVHGKCLDVHQSGTASGTPVDLWSCNGSGAQQWRLVPGDGGVTLVNPASGLCLTDPGDATANGTALQIATCTSATGQVWRAQ